MKNTPVAKGVRTLLLVLASYASTWAAIDFVYDWRAGSRVVTLNVISALIAAAIAYFQAFTRLNATTIFAKAWASLAQVMAGGLSAIAVETLTREAAAVTARTLTTTLVAAVIAFVTTLAVNAAEDLGATSGPET